MSSEEYKNIISVLKGILNPDNNIRKEAEAQLAVFQKNVSGLLYYLSQVLIDSEVDKSSKTLASVLIRKLLKIGEKEDVSEAFCSLDEKYRNVLKENILKAVINEKDKLLKIKFCDTMASVAENVFNYNDKWGDFKLYLLRNHSSFRATKYRQY